MPAVTRRENLKRLLEQRFNGRIADLGRAIEKDDAYVWQLLNDKRNIGERSARHIELKLELAPGSLDSATMSGQTALTADELELVQRYREASPTWKLMLRILAKQRGETHEDIPGDVRAILAKVAGQHVPDDEPEAHHGKPRALHQSPPPPYRKK